MQCLLIENSILFHIEINIKMCLLALLTQSVYFQLMPYRTKPFCLSKLVLKHFYSFVMHLCKFPAFGTDKMIVVAFARLVLISGFFITNFNFFGNADFAEQLERAMYRCKADVRRYFPDLIVQVIVRNMPACGKEAVDNGIPLQSMSQSPCIK